MSLTYIAKDEQGLYWLVNGNPESEESWSDYEEAKEALKADNELLADIVEKNDLDLDYYYDNSQINWVA